MLSRPQINKPTHDSRPRTARPDHMFSTKQYIYTFANGWTWANFEAHGESGLNIGLITKQPPRLSDKLQTGPTKGPVPVDNGELIQ